MTTILVIEDNTPIRREICAILELEGFQALSAATGEEGIAAAVESLPDLIICDITMPGYDGYAVLEALQQNGDTARIPFIFLTARSTSRDIRLGMTRGADDYLTKPFTIDELLGAVRTRLRRMQKITEPLAQEVARTRSQLDHALRIDNATGLPNRKVLEEHLADSRQGLPATFNRALILMSIDHYQQIRYALGYDMINRVIKRMTARLARLTGAEESLYRLESDTFAVLLTGLVAGERAHRTAELVREAVKQPIKFGESSLNLTISVGLSTCPGRVSSPAKLIPTAETALFHAIENGGNQVRVYQPYMEEHSINRLSLIDQLYNGLKRHEFAVYYQPKLALGEARIVGMEALIRWNHPEVGMVLPGLFMPAAEETELIHPLGDWLLNEACTRTIEWHNQGYRNLQVSVNISARQLEKPDFVQKQAGVLSATKLDPKALELEVTERAFPEDLTIIQDTLNRIKDMGVHLCIDDFGTGCATLSTLQQLPFDSLKLDQSFVCNLMEKETDVAITLSMLRMARLLGLGVVAEGVETEAQKDFLTENGCNQMQGFLFSKPLSHQAFSDLLTRTA